MKIQRDMILDILIDLRENLKQEYQKHGSQNSH